MIRKILALAAGSGVEQKVNYETILGPSNMEFHNTTMSFPFENYLYLINMILLI